MESSRREKLRRSTRRLLPVALGGTLGYGYYQFIGCATGTCPITSNPWSTTAYGMLIGWVLARRPDKARQGAAPEQQKGEHVE